MENFLSWSEFERVEMRVGTIINAEAFPKARKPAFKLTIDFGEKGIKRTSAQITKLYSLEQLLGMQVVAVINFPPKQIADFMSECLVLGAVGDNGEVTLLQPNLPATNGLRIA
jgi:tRNA-binding protein